MATASEKFKILKTLNIAIDIILSDTIQYLTSQFNQSRTVFTAASPFGQLLLVVENLTQLVFYYIEDSITELNINEATRLTSVYSLASLAGHNPSRAMSAVGEISLSTTSAAVDAPTDVVIIPNMTKLSCLNNSLTYILDLPQDDVKFALNGADNGIKFQIRQGIIETQTVVSRGLPMESFSIGNPQNFYIDNFYLSVYVNGEKWKKYESFMDMPRNAKGYVAKTGITSGLDIYFGNTNFGKIPPSGATIQVEYLITEGANGNLRTSDPKSLSFQFADTGFSLLGEEVDLNKYTTLVCTNSPYFGANPEDSRVTRLVAPHTSKSFALVNEKHYEILLRKLNLFSMIRVFIDPIDSRMLDLFLVLDARKAFKNSLDYFGASLDKFIMNDYQKNKLLQYIEKSGSKLISTEIMILDPVVSRYVINVAIIVFDDVATEIIKRDIYYALGNFFVENTRRGRIPRSDLIKLIEEINGVDTVQVTLISEKNELAKLANPNAADVGTDSFNDILIEDNELAIIRGGFSDRYGNQYVEGLSEQALGAVNINIREITPRPTLMI